MEKTKELLLKLQEKFSPERQIIRGLLLIAGVFSVLCLVGIGVTYGYVKLYEGKVYPGVRVGDYELGGLTPDQVKNIVETANNRYAKEGIQLDAVDSQGKEHTLRLPVLSADDSSNQIYQLDSDRMVQQALTVGRTGSGWERLWKPLFIRWSEPVHLTAPIVENKDAVLAGVHTLLDSLEDKSHNATVAFAPGTVDPQVVPEKEGYIFDYTKVTDDLRRAVGVLSFAPVSVRVAPFTPVIEVADVQKIMPRLPQVLQYGNISFNYIDPQTKVPHDWEIKPVEFVQWLEVRRDEDQNLVFALNAEKVKEYLETNVRPLVDVPAAEAKFAMADGKVQEFEASQTGLTFNADKTYADLDAAFVARNFSPTDPIKTVTISVDIAEPKIKTADVNNLGITDIVGVGVSSFKGSHPDRIKNVARAVQLLNGVLIRPGETFSTAKNVGPITPENGYYPELVIKGDDASQKEVGGGMCQIGTTLFRMAMNSGMPIVERQNHSLVVNYYADPVNGNPGTDATIYDPVVDFKFLNDTGNYLLLQTDMNMKTLQLTFTLWGKKDGRSGSYTHPLVSKWLSVGDPVNVAVTDGSLKPGEKQCQPAYRGAVASFTYSRVTPDGQKIDQVFTSYYRSLPKTCRIGVDPADPCLANNTCFTQPPAIVSSTPST